VEPQSPYKPTLIICLAEIFGLASIAAFPALLPIFLIEWQLSNTAAGWISASYYAGYMVFVPVLSGITDRMDARKVMAFGALIGVFTALGFAFLARGFWSALLLRFISGISLAGIYMPGLKLVSDATEGSLQSRFVSFYTASFSVGVSLSYLLAGEINAMAGWRWAFGAAAVSAALAWAMIMACIPAGKPLKPTVNPGIADFLTVLRCRAAMAYVLAYAAHMWELFAFRSWVVAFLAFSLHLQPAGGYVGSATQLAFLISLIGLPASIGGNELARRYGRRRVISAVMLASAACGALLGFTAAWPYLLVTFLALVYGVMVTADSAALTAGAVAAAPDGLRGTTLAVHSTLGFGAAFLGPLAVGVVLDLFSGTPFVWGMGFIAIASSSLLGPIFLYAVGGSLLLFRADQDRQSQG
jgi:MFS family permease